jgi:hypothetical protein
MSTGLVAPGMKDAMQPMSPFPPEGIPVLVTIEVDTEPFHLFNRSTSFFHENVDAF